jgi:hypothetical protein
MFGGVSSVKGSLVQVDFTSQSINSGDHMVFARTHRVLFMLICCAPTIAIAQQNDTDRALALLGCWATNVGVFKATQALGPDSALKNVPPIVRLDSLPGFSPINRKTGRLITAIPGRSRTSWREGYYTLGAGDVVAMTWTTGFVSLSFTLRQSGDAMSGEAKVRTDTQAEERAPITLRRIPCP